MNRALYVPQQIAPCPGMAVCAVSVRSNEGETFRIEAPKEASVTRSSESEPRKADPKITIMSFMTWVIAVSETLPLTTGQMK